MGETENSFSLVMRAFILSSLLTTCYSSAIYPTCQNCRYEIQEQKQAVVELEPGNSNVTGKIYLQSHGTHVSIVGSIFGLTPGLHGFHIHVDLADSCKAAGGHFNPDMNPHSSPNSLERHAGDLGNIYTPNSPITLIYKEDSVITLGDGGPRDVAGRGVVVHAGEDDLGQGTGDKAEGSKKTGNAGARVACGIIKLIN